METLEQLENKINERLSSFKNDDNLFLYLNKINSIQNVSIRSACILYEQDIEDNNFFREYSELNDEEKQEYKNDKTYFFVKPMITKIKQGDTIKHNLKFNLVHCYGVKIERIIKTKDYKILIEKIKKAILPTKPYLDRQTQNLFYDKSKNAIKLNNSLSKNEIVTYLLNFLCEKNRCNETDNEIKIATYFSLINLGYEKNKVCLGVKDVSLKSIIVGKYLSEKVLKVLSKTVIDNNKISSSSAKQENIKTKKTSNRPPKTLDEAIEIATIKFKKLQEEMNG